MLFLNLYLAKFFDFNKPFSGYSFQKIHLVYFIFAIVQFKIEETLNLPHLY